MKLLPALLVLIASFAAAAPVKNSDPDWKPVIGFSSPGSKGYYDKSSVDTRGEGKRRITFAIILLIRDKPETVNINGKVFTARSIARGVIMDCQSGNIMPLGDLYYATEFPKEKDDAVHSVEYDTKVTPVVIGNTKSPLYHTLCPTYI